MLEEEYTLDYFRSQGFVRKICKSCGAAFWTRDPEQELCGDAPCVTYNFIGNPVFKPHTVDEMREAFLSFFERHGHTRLQRYPVAARWRDDIYLTIASIADFQPFVTSGVVPPPANPLTISQPCIRLNDLDSVGRSGRHLTLFEMMAHHAFNTPEEQVYWKEETVALCDEFIASIGGDLNRVSYKEHPWYGGGNAGASVEVLIGGLEVATLVFMNLGRQKTDQPPVDVNGEPYYPMRLKIVDTGYGLERFVWASKGSPTIYDAVFPEMVSRLMRSSHLEHLLDNPEFTKIMGLSARFAGVMDISGTNLYNLRRKVAEAIDVPVERLERIVVPIEKVYSVADHTRCLAYMLGDCIVPSNVREGYLARLVLRRTLRMMNDLSMDEDLGDLIEAQMQVVGTGNFGQSVDVVREIVESEEERYAATLERGTRIVQKIARNYKAKSTRVPLAEVITLYDSHGIPPEMVKDVAAAEGAVVEVPDNFYSLIADIHSEAQKAAEGEDPLAPYRERAKTLPPTKKLFYDLPNEVEFEAMVLDYFDGMVVLDQTLFYPEGGGQPSDTGTLVTSESMVRVEEATKVGEVILHRVTGGPLKRGERVKGMVDEERRRSLMRHHTATHVLLHAAKKVLGVHVHQAGAQKGSETSRLDVRHYTHITPDELKRIEIEANRLVMADTPVYIHIEERTKAEQKYGFDLYQGGVPPGREIRTVRVASDVQACAGTHVRTTGEIGFIRVIGVEHIQDGVERLVFAAGIAAVHAVQHMTDLLQASSDVLSVQPENLPAAVARFFSEWKEQKKEIERLQKSVVDLQAQHLEGEMVDGVRVVVRQVDAAQKELVDLASSVSAEGGVALFVSGNGNVKVVAASGVPMVNAADIVRKVCGILGGKGGGKPTLAQGAGTDASRLDEALEHGRREILEALHG
ncbi:MAG: alanine--tRNA ligase [Methanoculleus sp.]|uniref:alanine--tRNA ligase n=3 Tax=Methanoculleus TaxID=45989 RepID=UPI0025DBB793|nr:MULTISPECIES: alanine--tRNA ligase [unclassified Methanoculleus]MCK9318471.1 alanine--tRNA ligase [Methanoculleus sp.]MDD2254335.1 alanine--tRNA ligase [Methanoculleus sp.]MDD3216730.1 alanine--tRNA ligase [Methanoculleus sp.]MDD4313589.1 alanine--tRNA ligase [Methanoculleus sp.]MDD4470828.1 alanine--tRNA ligase [Methanoculleus sp.]